MKKLLVLCFALLCLCSLTACQQIFCRNIISANPAKTFLVSQRKSQRLSRRSQRTFLVDNYSCSWVIFDLANK